MNINLFNDVADCFGISDCIGIFANNDSASYPFKRQSHKMAKHTQTIRRIFVGLSVFDHFAKLALNGLRTFESNGNHN